MDKCFESIAVENKDPIPGEVMRSVLDFSKAKNNFNWEPKHNIDDGMKITYQWFENK